MRKFNRTRVGWGSSLRTGDIYVVVFFFHLQLIQIWQACKGSFLNLSDGIVIQIPTRKHAFHPKQQKAPTSSKWKHSNTVWEGAQIAVRAPWRIQTSSENNNSRTVLIQWPTPPTLHRYCFRLYLRCRLSLRTSFHLQLFQVWQACKSSFLNHSDGIVIQIPTSKHIPSKYQKRRPSSNWEEATVWEGVQIAVRAPWRI